MPRYTLQAQIQEKSDATRLKNLLARKADNENLSKGDETILKRLKDRAKAKG